MKLSTTTADFRGFAASQAETVLLFESTSFRLLDLNHYEILRPGSAFLEADDSVWRREVDAVGEASARIGARFIQAHAPDGEHYTPGEARDRLRLAMHRHLEACAILGIKQTVVHAAGRPEFTPTQFLEANRDYYRELFDDAERFNITLLTENSSEQNSPYYYLRTGRELREFVEYVDHPLLRVCWDTGHANMRPGMDQYQCLRDIGNLLAGLHIQDNFGISDMHTAPYNGTCNYDPVLQALADIGYPGTFNFECSNLLRQHDTWPVRREPWQHNGKTVEKVLNVPLQLRRLAIELVYETGKYMLSQYGCFED